MKGTKMTGFLAFGLGTALFLSGCSFSSSLNNVMGTVTSTSKETVISTSEEEGDAVAPKKYDASLAVPAFSDDLSGTTNVVQNGAVTLQTSATVSDGGTVTYQWYSNTVDSNGGGTRIEGATGDSYSPSTAEGGTVYYYVVAINDHGDSVNEAVSATHAVTVWANMYWQQNADNGGYQYLNHDDGSYPSNTTLEIDGVTYTFNENGFAVDPASGNLIDITTGQAAAPVQSDSSAAEPSDDTADTQDDGSGTDDSQDAASLDAQAVDQGADQAADAGDGTDAQQ